MCAMYRTGCTLCVLCTGQAVHYVCYVQDRLCPMYWCIIRGYEDSVCMCQQEVYSWSSGCGMLVMYGSVVATSIAIAANAVELQTPNC